MVRILMPALRLQCGLTQPPSFPPQAGIQCVNYAKR